MARTSSVHQDPWKEMVRRRGNRQVELEEIARGLALETRAARQLKKELLERIFRLTREK